MNSRRYLATGFDNTSWLLGGVLTFVWWLYPSMFFCVSASKFLEIFNPYFFQKNFQFVPLHLFSKVLTEVYIGWRPRGKMSF